MNTVHRPDALVQKAESCLHVMKYPHFPQHRKYLRVLLSNTPARRAAGYYCHTERGGTKIRHCTHGLSFQERWGRSPAPVGSLASFELGKEHGFVRGVDAANRQESRPVAITQPLPNDRATVDVDGEAVPHVFVHGLSFQERWGRSPAPVGISRRTGCRTLRGARRAHARGAAL